MNFPKLSTFTLIAALAAATTGAGFLAQAHAADTATKQKQPHMRAALVALERAKAELKMATDDKGNHKGPAQKAIDEAIAQVKAGIKADNTTADTK